MTRIGPYELQERLGQGGMGDVFRARELSTGRTVALKVLRAEASRTLQRERFIREARALAQLRSPYIVSIHTAGEDEGRLYYVMDHIEGESLDARLTREGPLPLEEAVRITRCLTQAVEHAHAHGILHRDIKPGNVLLTPEGTPLLADFGLTKFVSEESRRLTATGVMAGTLGFTPPEQVRDARKADERADIYALGATLYSMLTCRPPVPNGNILAMVIHTTQGHIHPPSTLRPEVDARLDAVVMRMLALDPDDRYASSGEVRADLDSYSSGSVPEAVPASSRRRPWWMPWALLVAALTLVVSLAADWRPPPVLPPPPPPTPTAATSPGVDPALLLLRAREAFATNAPAATLFPALEAAREAARSPADRAEMKLLTARAASRRCRIDLGLELTEGPHAPDHASELRYLRADLLRRDGQHIKCREILRALAAGADRWALLATAELELLARKSDGPARLSPAVRARLERELPDDPKALRLRLIDSLYERTEDAGRRLMRRVRTQALARGDAAMMLSLIDLGFRADATAVAELFAQAERLLPADRPVEWHATHARHLMLTDRIEEAVTGMKRALEVRPRGQDALTLGRLQEELGRTDDALSTWGRAYDRHGLELLRLARERPLELRILRGALAPVHSATTPLPDAVQAAIAEDVAPLPTLARRAAQRLLGACARGVPAEALLPLLKTLRGPEHLRGRITADVLLSRDRFVEAEEALDRAAAAGDDSLELKVLRCRLGLQAGDAFAASESLAALQKADPHGWAGLTARAFLRLYEGDFLGAQRHAEAALAKRRHPLAYAARVLALVRRRELVRASVVASAGFARTWYLDRWLGELVAETAATLASARAGGSMGTGYDPKANEEAFVQFEHLMRVTHHPRIRLNAARRLFEIPPGPDYRWALAAHAWIAEARAQLKRRDRPPRLGRAERERLERELRAVDGMRILLDRGRAAEVDAQWRGLTEEELGPRFLLAYRSLFRAPYRPGAR